MKFKTHYIKSITLAVALAGESYFLSNILLTYIKTSKFFSPPREFLIQTILIILLILYTYFLTIGGWGKWEQYLTVAFPIALGIAIKVLQLNYTYAILVFITVLALLSYDMLITTHLTNQMLKFNPKIILKLSSRGIVFVFSLSASIFVLLYSPKNENGFDLGKKIGSIAQKQFDNLIEPNLKTKNLASMNPQDMKKLSQDIPESDKDSMSNLPAINFDLKNTIEKEFNKVIAPYKQFIPPLIALIVFTFIRFLGGISRLVFSLTTKLVYGFFKKIGFLHVNLETVKKETITFEPKSNKNLLKAKKLRANET